ncbi:MAG: tol-pal system protein YbgF [Pseudomonadota bacterium]
MRFLSVVLAVFALSAPAQAQDAQSLADIRAELGVLQGEMALLRAELAPSGAASTTRVTGDTLQRMDAIEAGLTRLNSKAEELENRINRIVADGTNRIGDIEFRLVELEGGDLGSIGETAQLGGATGTLVPAAPSAPAPATEGPELAIGEKSDYERAQEALASGDFQGAAEKFAAFTQSYPGSPLEADAEFLRGSALEQTGDMQGAARAFLASFSGNPESPRAPEALYKLGLSLDALGQANEACLMLQEVIIRFPTSPQVTPAQQSRASLGCS